MIWYVAVRRKYRMLISQAKLPAWISASFNLVYDHE
jgi:hypothetical protein